MPEHLQKEIEGHLASFPERRRDFEEMRKEWREFKDRCLWILVGFLSAVLAIGVWVGTIQTHVSNITETANRAALQAENVEKRINALEITNGEIRTKLSGIEVVLQEIKVAIRQLNY